MCTVPDLSLAHFYFYKAETLNWVQTIAKEQKQCQETLMRVRTALSVALGRIIQCV